MELFERNAAFKKSLDDLHLSKLRDREKAAVVAEDEDQKDSLIVPYPNSMDVLLGKGRSCQEFAGNRRLLELVEARYAEYQGSRKDDKATIANEIVKSIHQSGQKFLETVEGVGWKIVSDDIILRNKVTQAFRAQKRNQKSNATSNSDELSSLSTTTAATAETDPDEGDNLGLAKKPRTVSK